MGRVESISMLEITWCYRQYSDHSLVRVTVVECWRTKIRISYWSIPPPLKISRVSEFYQEEGSKGEAASTDFPFLCFLKLDAYFPCRPSKTTPIRKTSKIFNTKQRIVFP